MAKAAVRAVLRQPVFAPLLGRILAKRLRLLHDCADPDALDVLVFSDFRWKQDLQALARVGGLRLFAIDRGLQSQINALFEVPGHVGPSEYFMEEEPLVLGRRAAQARFIERLVPSLLAEQQLDCAITAAVHYMQEHAWAEGFVRAGLPFVALHKEFTILDPRHLPERIERFKGRRQKFLGSQVCVTNRVGHTLFSESGVFPPEKISVMGLMRMDSLLDPALKPDLAAPKDDKVVTLFSFGHLSGGLSPAQWRSHYFSLHDEIGFVDLFREVHVAFAELALRHPDVQFKIKPKNVSDWWIVEIEQVVQDALGLSLDEIPNCSIVDEPAPDLIAQSRATIAFNSTVILESRLLGCNTIMPVFAEATGRHVHNVFFPEFRDVFAVASSREHLVALIERALQGERLHPEQPERLSALCREYFGYDDGRTAWRALEVLRDVVAGRPPPREFEGGPSVFASPDLAPPRSLTG